MKTQGNRRRGQYARNKSRNKGNAGSLNAGAGAGRAVSPAASKWRFWRHHGDPTDCYSRWVYFVFFALVDFLVVMESIWAVTLDGPVPACWNFFAQMFTQGRFVFLLNFLVVGVAYFAVIALFNRFWAASAVFSSLALVLCVVDRMKVEVRNATILPSDLGFVGGDSSSLMSFIPPGSGWLITGTVLVIIAGCLLCGVFALLDGGKATLLPARETRRAARRAARKTAKAGKKAARKASRPAFAAERVASRGRGGRHINLGVRIVSQILLIAAPIAGLVSFSVTLGTSGEWGHDFAQWLGDQPAMWDSVTDAQTNGTLIGFLRFTHVTVMQKPSGYSQAEMDSIAQEYAQVADEMNKTRANELTNNNVIAILSESYSDPTRVPGVKLNKDPMPYVRELKTQTTSGLMLSSGYGGGTANLEYEEITGLSMANFDGSLTSPYQQLVPDAVWAPSFNQLWNEYGSGSLAFHPYMGSMYSRETNYRGKFGFQHFWTLDGPEYIDTISCVSHVDNSPYVSDKCAYGSVLNELKKNQAGDRYYQLETMQNHMPYDQWYSNNPFIASSTTSTPLPSDEKSEIETYADGMYQTDLAVKWFLGQLNQLNVPVTVIWYGDHLPGIYEQQSENPKNTVALHETDYFIWSNKATHLTAQEGKLPASEAAYSSPNYFMSEVAEQTNSKVSPYLAFLTKMHEAIAALQPPVSENMNWGGSMPSGESLDIMSDGKQVSTADLSAQAKKLLHQYRLIQYDITCGKHYLKSTGFMDLPQTMTGTAMKPGK